MEIRIRPILAIIVTATVAAVGGLFVVPRLAQLAPSRSGVPVVPTTGTPASDLPAGSPAAGAAAVTYVDESLGWDWQVSCEPQFQRFLVEKLTGQPVRAVKVVLVDYKSDSKLSFGVRYPDESGAQANANCFAMGGGNYSCSVGVERGEPGASLDVAATLAAPYTLLDMFLARGTNPNAIRQTWHWATFQPLITPKPEGTDQWQSACLQLSRAR